MPRLGLALGKAEVMESTGWGEAHLWTLVIALFVLLAKHC